MKIGEVIGTVVATQKDESLVGCKLLIVKLINCTSKETTEEVIAVDTFGAGVGEKVLVCFGSAAKSVFNKENIPIDASVVGIIDSIENA